MTDIVERMRERARGGFAHDELDEEAADEIERLRAALAECAADYVLSPGSMLQGAMYTVAEFQRRMSVARRALEHKP